MHKFTVTEVSTRYVDMVKVDPGILTESMGTTSGIVGRREDRGKHGQQGAADKMALAAVVVQENGIEQGH